MESGEPRHSLLGPLDYVLVMEVAAEPDSLLVHQFQRLGCEVDRVRTAEAAIAAAEARKPDLIIVDRQHAPQMDTQELVHRLRTHPVTAVCPIVVASQELVHEIADLSWSRPREADSDATLDQPYTRAAIAELIAHLEPGARR